jgi:hypothetical protein
MWRAARVVVPAVALATLAGSGASAQVASLIQINTLTSEQAGGCYPGTSGADATMFLRAAPGFTGCDFGDFNNDVCLARREFAADGPDGREVSNGDTALLRPSVYGDGTIVFFVRNFDLCVMESDDLQQDVCYNLPNPGGQSAFVHFVSASPQGNLLGLIPRDLNNINLPANVIEIRLIQTYPNVPIAASYQFISPALYPDSLDFMARGPWIVFDASDSPFLGGNYGLHLVDRNTGQLLTLAPPVAGYQLRNPVFGRTSDDVIAFDAIELATGQTTVLTADLLTGAVHEIAQVNVNPAVPSFNGDDTAVIFHREDAGVFSAISLRSRGVDADRVTPVGAEKPHLANGGFPWMYRRGTFDDSPIPCPEPGRALGVAVGALAVVQLSRRRPRGREAALVPPPLHRCPISRKPTRRPLEGSETEAGPRSFRHVLGFWGGWSCRRARHRAVEHCERFTRRFDH